MLDLVHSVNSRIRSLSLIDFTAPLAFRLILAFAFWYAGWQKFGDGGISPGFVGLIDSMGFPLPTLFAYLAALTEIVGAVLLLLGFGVRWIVFPLMATMIVAILGVHWDNGWLAIASGQDPDIACRLQRINEIVNLYGRPDWLRAEGSIVILNNGVQFGVIYFTMLLSLLFTGGGRLVSVDYWLNDLIE